MQDDALIYDVGLHKGEDSEFYLNKGFRVVAVDANPDMCEVAARRLDRFIKSGRLKILNAAVAEKPGTVKFFRNRKSDWGTMVREWADLNAHRGHSSEEITVEAVTLADLVHEHGEAYYIKIDIEGMDQTALQSLRSLSKRPKYVSIESAFPRNSTLRNASAEFAALSELGYDRFKIVAQHEVSDQVPPNPPREGQYVPTCFEDGSSGLFGDEAPGEWVSLEQALRAMKLVVLKSWPESWLLPYWRLHHAYVAAKWRLIRRPEAFGWYDIHACRSA